MTDNTIVVFVVVTVVVVVDVDVGIFCIVFGFVNDGSPSSCSSSATTRLSWTAHISVAVVVVGSR